MVISKIQVSDLSIYLKLAQVVYYQKGHHSTRPGNHENISNSVMPLILLQYFHGKSSTLTPLCVYKLWCLMAFSSFHLHL